jgi:hypothetical protein
VSTWSVWYQAEGERDDLPPHHFMTFDAACRHARWLMRTFQLIGKPHIARHRW